MKCEWKQIRIGDLGLVITGKTPQTKNAKYWGGHRLFITPKDLQRTKHIFQTERIITDAGLESVKGCKLPARAVCVSCIGNIGYVGMTTQDCISNQQINSIVVNKDYDADYVYYVMRGLWPLFKKYEGSSTALSILNKSQFSNIRVRVVTDIKVQRRIAAILSSLDDKIELNNKINANLEQQGAEFVRQYRSVTDVDVPLSDIMSFDNGFPFQSGTYLSSGRYRVITIKNVQDGYIDSKGAAFIDKVPLKMKPNCVLHVGDVLLSLTGNVGRVGIVCESGLLLNQRVAKIMPKKQELLPFLYFFYRQSDMKILLGSIAKGTAQLNLSPVETLNLTVPYKEESAILLSRLLSRLFQKVVANTQENLTLSTLRDALLPRLMSGQIEL